MRACKNTVLCGGFCTLPLRTDESARLLSGRPLLLLLSVFFQLISSIAIRRQLSVLQRKAQVFLAVALALPVALVATPA